MRKNGIKKGHKHLSLTTVIFNHAGIKYYQGLLRDQMIEKKKETSLHFGIKSVIRTEDNAPTKAFIRFCFIFIHYVSTEKLHVISLRRIYTS